MSVSAPPWPPTPRRAPRQRPVCSGGRRIYAPYSVTTTTPRTSVNGTTNHVATAASRPAGPSTASTPTSPCLTWRVATLGALSTGPSMMRTGRNVSPGTSVAAILRTLATYLEILFPLIRSASLVYAPTHQKSAAVQMKERFLTRPRMVSSATGRPADPMEQWCNTSIFVALPHQSHLP